MFRFWTLEGAPTHLSSRLCSGFYSEQKCVFSIFDFVGVVWRKYIFYQNFSSYEFNSNSYDIEYHIWYLFKIGFSYRNLWPGGHVLMMREAFLMVHHQHLNFYRDSEPRFWGWNQICRDCRHHCLFTRILSKLSSSSFTHVHGHQCQQYLMLSLVGVCVGVVHEQNLKNLLKW